MVLRDKDQPLDHDEAGALLRACSGDPEKIKESKDLRERFDLAHLRIPPASPSADRSDAGPAPSSITVQSYSARPLCATHGA